MYAIVSNVYIFLVLVYWVYHNQVNKDVGRFNIHLSKNVTHNTITLEFIVILLSYDGFNLKKNIMFANK